MAKVYISPSDQSANKYAYGDTNEAIQCRRIADALENALKRCGFEVRNNKTDGMAVRCEESDAWGREATPCLSCSGIWRISLITVIPGKGSLTMNSPHMAAGIGQKSVFRQSVMLLQKQYIGYRIFTEEYRMS